MNPSNLKYKIILREDDEIGIEVSSLRLYKFMRIKREPEFSKEKSLECVPFEGEASESIVQNLEGGRGYNKRILLIIIESVDSINRDERGFPLTQYITNRGISCARNTITHFKHHHRVLWLISNRMSV